MMISLDRTILSLVFGAVLWIALTLVLIRFASFRPILALPLGLMVGLAAAVFLSQSLAYTPPILGSDGKPLPGSIAVMEQVQLNGRNEWVIIRGHNQTKPVLLFVSGGPVGSELGWEKRYNADLEKDFVLVIWEQPGGGKSYPAINYRTIQMEDYISDGLELTEWLRERFHQYKIFLAGHSWGTMLTIWMAQQHPDYYRAIVNIGQMVNPVENDLFGYQLSLDAARKANDAKLVAELEKNGPPPYGKNGALKYNAYLNNAYGANALMTQEIKNHEYTKGYLSSGFNIPEYGLLDRGYWFLGLIDGMNYIYSPQLDQVDLTKQVAKLDVPLYFATGRHDYNAWFKLTEQYYNALEAPKKELVWFEDSGHDPNCSEVDKFITLMRRVLEEN